MHITSPGARALAPTTPAISASFTPGPWREHSHRQIGPDAGIVCEVWSAIGWGDAAIQQADANVRLIAAAARAAPGAKGDHRRQPARTRPRATAHDEAHPCCPDEGRRGCSMSTITRIRVYRALRRIAGPALAYRLSFGGRA